MKAELVAEFSGLFDQSGELKTMNGPPMQIELKEDATPYAVNGARPIPFAQRDEVKRMLDEMIQQNVITPVSEPTEWFHPLVVVGKPNGKLRLCVDMTKLNRHVKRPTHPIRTPKDAVAEISSSARYFSTFDAAHGYWQIQLEEASQLYTTFMTPWGKFKFLRATMGLVSAGDEYNRRSDLAFVQVKGHF